MPVLALKVVESDMVTYAQAATITSMTPRWLRELVKRGELHVVQVGKHVRGTHSSLRLFRSECEALAKGRAQIVCHHKAS